MKDSQLKTRRKEPIRRLFTVELRTVLLVLTVVCVRLAIDVNKVRRDRAEKGRFQRLSESFQSGGAMYAIHPNGHEEQVGEWVTDRVIGFVNLTANAVRVSRWFFVQAIAV